jgi:hypothetical protein
MIAPSNDDHRSNDNFVSSSDAVGRRLLYWQASRVNHSESLPHQRQLSDRFSSRWPLSIAR